VYAGMDWHWHGRSAGVAVFVHSMIVEYYSNTKSMMSGATSRNSSGNSADGRVRQGSATCPTHASTPRRQRKHCPSFTSLCSLPNFDTTRN
jgi:hypothetical protein